MEEYTPSIVESLMRTEVEDCQFTSAILPRYMRHSLRRLGAGGGAQSV